MNRLVAYDGDSDESPVSRRSAERTPVRFEGLSLIFACFDFFRNSTLGSREFQSKLEVFSGGDEEDSQDGERSRQERRDSDYFNGSNSFEIGDSIFF